MPVKSTYLRGVAPYLIALSVVGLGVWAYGVTSPLSAKDGDAPAGASDVKTPNDSTKSKKRRGAHNRVSKPADVPATPAFQDDITGSTPTTPDGKTPDGKTSPQIDFAAQLDKAGASACHSQVNALATATMGKVEQYNTVSNWSQDSGDKRAVSLAIGQKYANGSAVPFGVSQVISAPNQRGSCDGFTVQVLPSPLTCAKLRDSITVQHGQQIGDLAGISLMQNAAERTMLVPTGAGTCVLVATRTLYAK